MTTVTNSAATTMVLPPITVGRVIAAAEVGRTLYFYDWDDPANTTISTDNPDILRVTPGQSQDGWVSTPTAVGLKPGTACVTITPSPRDKNKCELTGNIVILAKPSG